jgi:hypothetical protein
MARQIKHYNFSPVKLLPCGMTGIMVETDTDSGEWVRWKDVVPYINKVQPTVDICEKCGGSGEIHGTDYVAYCSDCHGTGHFQQKIAYVVRRKP